MSSSPSLSTFCFPQARAMSAKLSELCSLPTSLSTVSPQQPGSSSNAAVVQPPNPPHLLFQTLSEMASTARELAAYAEATLDSLHQLPRPACPICLEAIPLTRAVLLGDCAHVICKPCALRYLKTVALETKKYPIACPTCAHALSDERCLRLARGVSEVHDVLQVLMIEKVHMQDIRYCSYVSCGQAFDWVCDREMGCSNGRFRVRCPTCKRESCVQCKCAWHEGKSCGEYQEKLEGKDELLRLAKQEKWQGCPKCGMLIERQKGDCNFVRCRCGCGFCHKCGVKYNDLQQRSDNSHGTAGCECGLFGGGWRGDRVVAREGIGGVQGVGGDYIRWRVELDRQRGGGRRDAEEMVDLGRVEVPLPADADYVQWGRERHRENVNVENAYEREEEERKGDGKKDGKRVRWKGLRRSSHLGVSGGVEREGNDGNNGGRRKWGVFGRVLSGLAR